MWPLHLAQAPRPVQPCRLGNRRVNRHRHRTVFRPMRHDAAQSRRTLRLRQRRMGTLRRLHRGVVAVAGGVDFSGCFPLSLHTVPHVSSSQTSTSSHKSLVKVGVS